MSHRLLVTFLFLFIFICGKKYPLIHDIRAVKQFVDDPRRTMVLFDIDYTLIRPDFFVDREFIDLMDDTKDCMPAYCKLVEEFGSGVEDKTDLYSRVHMFLLEQEQKYLVETQPGETTSLINELQNMGVEVVGLTSRRNVFSRLTDQQLCALKIVFRNRFSQEVSLDDDRGCFNGVIYCGSNPKGMVLVCFLERMQEVNVFKRIWGFLKKSRNRYVFIDDHVTNLKSVETSFNTEPDLGAQSVICLHYSYPLKNEFNIGQMIQKLYMFKDEFCQWVRKFEKDQE